MTTPHAVALDYITTHQWPIFPCRAKDEDRLDRDGNAIIDPETGEVDTLKAKSPYTSKGFRSASKFPRIIERWWSEYPDAMIGIPTGTETGVWVLDVDVKEMEDGTVINGFDWLDIMMTQHGDLPPTRCLDTPRGGKHYYFRHVSGIRNKGGLAPGVDTRGDGGFVITGGSRVADGREYRWVDPEAPILDAPQWLLDLVLPPPAPAPTQTTPYTYTPGNNERYVERAVQAELDELASTSSGGRGEQVNTSAFNLGTIVGAGALSRAEAESGLYAAAQANGVVVKDGEREIRAKIKRGLDAGIRQPRQIPESQEDDLERWMPHKLLAKLRGKAEAVREAAEESDAESDDVEAKQAKAAPQPAPVPPADTTPPPAITATPFQWKDPQLLPRREFVYGTHLIRKYVSVTVSPGGIGKTSLTIAEALSMVTGKPLLGEKPPRKLNVWLFNAEDPRDEMDRRIMAAAKHYKLQPNHLEGLFLDSGREQEIIVARDDKRGVVIQEPIVDAVIDQIVRNKIDVMVIDPFVSTHAVSENDNGAIDRVAKLWGYIADVTNCAIEVVHHVRKSEGRDVTVEDARGAVSLLAAARSARVLNRMTDDQANAAGVAPQDRFSYFSVSRGKANLAVMNGSLEWRRLQSVPLGNGAGLSKPQDHAGVVTEWEWPSKESIAAAVPDNAKAQVLVQLKNQEYRENPQSPQWAGYVVAEAMGIDCDVGRAMTPDKKRAQKILEAWIDAGVLQVVEEDDPKYVGRKVKFIRPAA